MIEFRGYISGAAEKHFHKKSRNLGRSLLLKSALLVLPPIISLARNTSNWKIIGYFCAFIVLILLAVHLPKSKKERIAITPKKIYTEEDYIICVSDQYVESRMIKDVKNVYDHGEFYDLVFPFGKISDKFICQKNLLTEGTLAEFEALFDGKIVRK